MMAESSPSTTNIESGGENIQVSVSIEDKISRHISLLRKEKEDWLFLHQERNNGKSDRSENKDIPGRECMLTDEDKEFVMKKPDYDKFFKQFADLQNTILITEAQHDRAMGCFGNVSWKMKKEQTVALRQSNEMFWKRTMVDEERTDCSTTSPSLIQKKKEEE